MRAKGTRDPKRASQAQVMANSTENVLLARMDAESNVKNPRNVASAHRITNLAGVRGFPTR